jgi:hypothetical protein
VATSFTNRPGARGFGGFAGSGAPTPADLLLLLGVVFLSFSMQFFETTKMVPALLRLTPAVLGGFVWQLLSYPFIGTSGASIWFLLELLVLFWFGRDVFWRLGRRRFWRLILVAAAVAAVVAVATHALMLLAGGGSTAPFITMQGHRMLITILVAAFATLYGEATILLFFVLPVRARWFLWFEILAAFVFGLLPYKDLAGFLGVCAAVLVVYTSLRSGGLKRGFHDWRKRLERWILERRLARLRRRRPFEVVDGGRDEIVH